MAWYLAAMAQTVRVAYVEDDPEMAQFVKFGLEVAQAFDVAIYPDGATALAKLTAPPDVLLLDIGLPDLDGVELCGRLRARYPRLPILVLTAYPAERERALAAGASDFLAKPVTIRELRSRLRLLAGVV
ncbi:MAG TPA: response regulator [Thermodesulfobacteriota bacterium]|nr:response regulator [Thermodesulfobacteriota bacterium]